MDICSLEPNNVTFAFQIDTTAISIGKRYARTDEIGVPFAITVDFQTLEGGTVTLRERDTTDQVRIGTKQVVGVVRSLADGVVSWSDVAAQYPKVEAKEEK